MPLFNLNYDAGARRKQKQLEKLQGMLFTPGGETREMMGMQRPGQAPEMQAQQAAPSGLLANQPGGEMLSTALGTEFGPDVMRGLLAQMQPAGGQKPTGVMQNLGAAGYTPGTPEYQQAMKEYLGKASTEINMGEKYVTTTDAKSMRNQYGEMPTPGMTMADVQSGGFQFVDPTILKEKRDKDEMLGGVEHSTGAYRSAVEQYGAMPAWKSMTDPKAYNDLVSSYTDLQLEIKNLAELGVLAGEDLTLIRNVVQDPTSIKSNAAQFFSGENILPKQLEIVEKKIAAAKARAKSRYGTNWQNKAGGQPSSNKPVDMNMSEAELEAIISGK